MQTVVKDVMSKGQVVGQVEVNLFDNLDEAEEALGEERCVDLINRANTIATMDAKRREVTGTGGTGIRELMKKIKEHPELIEEINKLLGVEL